VNDGRCLLPLSEADKLPPEYRVVRRVVIEDYLDDGPTTWLLVAGPWLRRTQPGAMPLRYWSVDEMTGRKASVHDD
jgi:hypothetical protein